MQALNCVNFFGFVKIKKNSVSQQPIFEKKEVK